jgi:hypothetical protein
MARSKNSDVSRLVGKKESTNSEETKPRSKEEKEVLVEIGARIVLDELKPVNGKMMCSACDCLKQSRPLRTLSLLEQCRITSKSFQFARS